jgi:hypothetical protein
MDVKQLADFQAFSKEKLQKHSVFQSGRFFLDVYCLAPGQAQKPHRHATSDKVYHGPGSTLFAPAGTEHGVVNDGPDNARLLVLMTPPPEHA